jgi:hypothetical protein
MQGTKTRALAGDRRQRVQKIAGRARQPVKARHHQHIALPEAGGSVTSSNSIPAVPRRSKQD